MLKYILLIIMGMNAYFACLVFYSDSYSSGRKYYLNAEKTLIAQKQENAMLKERNEMLEYDVKNLSQNLGVIEEIVRENLGLVQQDETFYFIIEE